MTSKLPFGDTLRAQLGPPGAARRLGSSPRSRVWHVELPGGPAVVKQHVDGPDADERYTREAAALRLAARVDPPVAPRLLGTDPAARVLVLERLEHRAPADDWMVGYAATLARLHAAARPEDSAVLPVWSGPTADDAAAFLDLARRLDADIPARAPAELDDLLARLTRAPGRALLHGDPCPGNDLHTPGGVRFVDFEQAALGDGLVELAYLRIGFPTCWCVTVPSPQLLDRAEAAYDDAWYTATGTTRSGDLADACAGWLIRGDALVQRAYRGTADHLARVRHRDWSWGTVTARQRLLHRLGVVEEITADRADLAGVRQLCAGLGRSVRSRWPALRPPPGRRPVA
ncbi:aminoglycoside phosphotransferase family protein [Peterkaempfera griseoplana]|uniref:aminoglycoside phosphotransferase family protein n=1 Tax=Peterkaempfera griseoplana TaxID=66896 RepID=UPI0006E175C7|nr:aminoglycoside phosphotransferase family protein [Peterkaempfera griseoplana]